MLYFRTTLLWISFVLLILQNFLKFNNYSYGLIFRLLPSGMLLLWFLLSVFIKERLKIKTEIISKTAVVSIQILRPIASICIVLGAILKIMHLMGGNLMLVSGIGFMAVYSSILCKIAKPEEAYNPEIVDDTED